MRTISRYLLVEFAKASAAVFVGLYLVFVTADTLLHIDRLASDAPAALRWIFARSLDLPGVGVPVACVAGVVWSLTRAVRFREVTAIRCGGIPLRRALLPIIGACALIAVGLGLLEDRLLVPARVALAGAHDASDTEGPVPFRALGRWWYANETAYFSADTYDLATRTLTGVTAFLFDDSNRVHERIEAASATHFERDEWEFRDSVVLTFGSDGALVRRSVVAMRIDLGISASEFGSAARAPAMTTLHKLARRIREHVGEIADVRALQVIFHSRLAQPAAVVLLVLLAIPFAIGDVERGDSLPRALLASMGAAALYWIVWTVGQLLAQTGAVHAAIPIWGTSLAALAAALYRWRTIQE